MTANGPKTSFEKDWLTSGTLISSGEGRLLIGWGARQWQSAPSEHAIPSFYFPDFFLKNKTPWFLHEHYQEISAQELLSSISPPSPSRISHCWRHSHERLFYSAFQELKRKFYLKEIDKAVPFVMENSGHPMSPSQLVQSLISVLRYSLVNQAFLYGFWDEQEGILGATPELLFDFADDSLLHTMACAGTKSVQGDYSAMLDDPKELHEHGFVIEGIENSLAPFGKVEVGSLTLLKLSRLVHLVTPIAVKFHTIPTFEEIVRALHPTPAVGAFPREQGMKWLNEYQQKIDRRRFGAPVGYVFPTNKKASCYIAIRNAQWTSEGISIGAGCGLVVESQCNREWAEINLKLQAIKEMLAL